MFPGSELERPGDRQLVSPVFLTCPRFASAASVHQTNKWPSGGTIYTHLLYLHLTYPNGAADQDPELLCHTPMQDIGLIMWTGLWTGQEI